MTEDQLKKILAEALATQTEQFSENIDRLDKKLTEGLAKQFGYMQGEFASVRSEIQAVRSELKADIDRVYNLVDAGVKATETDEHERLAMTEQLRRHEGWLSQLATKLGIKLIPER